MAKSKFYGIQGDEPCVFDSWTECENFVKGKSVKFKSFATRQEAEVFAGITTATTPKLHLPGYFAYVDGSFGSKSAFAGWAWVLLLDGQEIAVQFGKTPMEALSRNIDGELYAAVDCMRYCIAKNIPSVTICHDYEGIEAWATGRWGAKSEIAIRYKEVIANFKQHLRLKFRKVAAHTGDPWNERVDQLAKKGISKS